MEEETCDKKSHILENEKYKFGIWKKNEIEEETSSKRCYISGI